MKFWPIKSISNEFVALITVLFDKLPYDVKPRHLSCSSACNRCVQILSSSVSTKKKIDHGAVLNSGPVVGSHNHYRGVYYGIW